MTKVKTRKSASEVYATVASTDGLLYHIAHARKENSSEVYDGGQLKKVSAKRRAKDISRFRETTAMFRERSIHRK
jgi:hypothetical protein